MTMVLYWHLAVFGVLLFKSLTTSTTADRKEMKRHGYRLETKRCIYHCPVDGVWSDYKAWSDWSSCITSFGKSNKTRNRTRVCDNPAPRHDGNPCAGSPTETESVSCRGSECSAPPTNVTVEVEKEYVEGVDATINCTAIINPNTTDLFLIGKGSPNGQITRAPPNGAQTYIEPPREDGCNSLIRKVYPADFNFLKDNNILACVAHDKEYGRNFTSEFQMANVIIIT